jgi:hypothetical protein
MAMMAASDITRREMSTSELMALLRERYPKDQYAFFTEVPNGTGSHANRHADALAMSLWPSRGLHLTGFELKVSRSDWVKELKNPAKAESFARYCHFWYLVVASESIVTEGELPPNWGLMAPTAGKLKVVAQAKILEPEAMSLTFIAGLFRAAQNQITQDARLATIRAQEYQKGVKAGQESRDYELRTLRKRVTNFEEKAGVLLTDYNHGSLVEAMKLVKDGVVGDVAARLASIRAQATRVVELIDAEEGKR